MIEVIKNICIIFILISDTNCHIVAILKENMIYDYFVYF